MGCNCRKRRMTQTTAAALAHAQEQGEQVSSEQVEALVAGAAHTAAGRDKPVGEASTTR